MKFGGISVLGDGQAELIESLLTERLGEREMEMERRDIRCGNACNFQGTNATSCSSSLSAKAGASTP